tara:strand:- start:160 stop:486 length:327 start_codon:yes stop_codon:yes gene_type:complete
MGFWKVTENIGTFKIKITLIILPILIFAIFIGLIIYNISPPDITPPGITPPDNQKTKKSNTNIVGTMMIILFTLVWLFMYFFRNSPGLKYASGLGTEANIASGLIRAL